MNGFHCLQQDNSVQDGERPEDAVQIQPQRVRIKIRPSMSSERCHQ